MINNEIRDTEGRVIGFRCSVCDGVKTKMWDNICNECRAKYSVPEPNHQQAAALLSEKETEIQRLREVIEQLRKVLEDCMNAMCHSPTCEPTKKCSCGVTEAWEAGREVLAAAASPRPEQTCIECGRGIGQLHKPQCSHTGRFLGEKEADVSAGAAHPTEGLYEGDVVP